MRLVLFVVASLQLVTTAPTQGITLLEGPSRTSLDVRILDESQLSASTVLMQDIEIMAIEISGRTAHQEQQTYRSRRLERDGLFRIELPGGGRLFHYSRGGGLFWGYLLVPASGMAQVLLEEPGLGADSPFADRIGVAADGAHALIPKVGGDFFVARLDGGAFASTGTPVRLVTTPAEVEPASAQVGCSFAFFITCDDRIYRVPLADQGTPVDCTPPVGASGDFNQEMSISGDGTKVVFMGGSACLDNIYLLGEIGSATAVTSGPSEFHEPNYLPEGSGQVALLLNDDGTRLFYIDESGDDEMFMLDTTGVLPVLQITDDPFFAATIGIHILPSFLDTSLIVAIGYAELMDWFKVDLTPGGGQVVNLTGTGSMTSPFPEGTMAPTQVNVLNGRLLVSETVGGEQKLRRLDPIAATSTVVATDLPDMPRTGSSFDATPDILVRGIGDRVYRGDSGLLLATSPPNVFLSDLVQGAEYGATFAHFASGLGIVVIYLDTGAFYASSPESGVEQLVVTQSGNLLVRAATLRLHSPQGYQQVTLPAANVQVIVSGAGG